MAQTAEEIAAQLRARIEAGDLSPGDRLPTMEQIAAEHGVSRQTARGALASIKAQGLAEYRGGRAGTVVRRRPTTRMVRSRAMERDNLGYYSGASVQHWRLVAGTQTTVTRDPAPTEVAQLLEVPVGTECVVRRRMNGDPEIPERRQLTDSWLHPTAVAELPILAGDTGLGGMYDRLEEWTREPIQWDEEISAITPSPTEAQQLLLPPGVPLLRVMRTSRIRYGPDRTQLVAEVNDIRMSAEQFSIRYPLSRRGAARWPVEPASRDFYTD